MDKKQEWIQLVEEKSAHYLNLGDGGFDEKMKVRLVRCNYEEQSVTYAFETQKWQINEKGGIHGGAILASPLLKAYIQEHYPNVSLHSSIILTTFAQERSAAYYQSLSQE